MFYQVYLVIAGMKLTILVLIVTDYIYIVILPHMVPATTTQSTKGKLCYDSPEYQGQTLLQQPRVPRANPATTTQSTKGKPCYNNPEYQGQTLLRQPRVPRANPATTAQSTKGNPCYDSPEYQGQTLLRQPRVPRTNHISKHPTNFITKVISINTLHHRLKTKSQTEVLIGTDCMRRCRGRRGRDRMVVGFTTTCAISAYHH
jgi:uncharacterized protein (DUF1330 family)